MPGTDERGFDLVCYPHFGYHNDWGWDRQYIQGGSLWRDDEGTKPFKVCLVKRRSGSEIRQVRNMDYDLAGRKFY